ncbi:MAG: phosphatase PAP2 family protein [Rubrivivax sp.]|nr:phosphatase PAP2 family protein [Rubrivivax sp.]
MARRRDLVAVAVGALVLAAWDASGLDLAAARLFGRARGFPARDAWWLVHLGHDGLRWLGWAIVAMLLANALRPWTRALDARQRWGWLALTLAGAALAPLMKQASLTSCPWELTEFGGVAAHVSHWRLGVADGGPGHCFPSGHASTAFALLSGWFVAREAYPRAARHGLAAVCLLGAFAGSVQLARGAHYPSHTLWTAWFCWTLNALAAPWLAPRSLETPNLP